MAINFALYHNWLCILLRSQGKCNLIAFGRGHIIRNIGFANLYMMSTRRRIVFDTVRLKSKEETAKKLIKEK